MFFSSIKEINRLWKLINRLLSKGMANIYLKFTIEKKWGIQTFDFLNLKSSSLGQFLGNSNSQRYLIFKLLVAILKSDVWEQSCTWLFYLFIYLFIFTFYFWKNFDVLNWKIPCFLLKIKFNKNETELKMENPNHSFSGIKHVLQVVYKLRIKRKTVISWSSRNKKYYIFCNNNFAQKKFI